MRLKHVAFSRRPINNWYFKQNQYIQRVKTKILIKITVTTILLNLISHLHCVCLEEVNVFLCLFRMHNPFYYKSLSEFSAFMCLCGRTCLLVRVTPGLGPQLWSHSGGPKSVTRCTDLSAAHLCACGVC